MPIDIELPRMPGETVADYNRRHKAHLQAMQMAYDAEADARKQETERIERIYSDANVASRAASVAEWAKAAPGIAAAAASGVGAAYGQNIAIPPSINYVPTSQPLASEDDNTVGWLLSAGIVLGLVAVGYLAWKVM